MDFTSLQPILEQLGFTAIPLAVLVGLSYVVKVTVNGIIGTFSIVNPMTKRILPIIIALILFLVYLLRDITYVQYFAYFCIFLGMIFLPSGMHEQAKEKNNALSNSNTVTTKEVEDDGYPMEIEPPDELIG